MKASVLTILLVIKGLNLFSQEQAETPDRKWKLVWSDEFNYAGLPDDTKWSYENGFIRGVEKQLYTVKRKENVTVQNGYLVITGKKESVENPNYQFKKDVNKKATYLRKFKNLKPDEMPNTVKNKAQLYSDYTSASLTTLKKASWTYGKVEVMAKVPEGKGVWPTIWLLGANRAELGWPKCGEIDIMEYTRKRSSNIFSNVHFANSSNVHVANSGNISLDVSPSLDFHKYSVEWDAKKIKFFIDDKLYHTVSTNNAGETFNKPFYLLINLALGGPFAGPVDDSALPQKFMIDYVRVYQ